MTREISKDELLKCFQTLLDHEPEGLHRGELTALVRESIKKRDIYMRAVECFGTPQYLLDEPRLFNQITRFQQAFDSANHLVRTHYAFKSNPSLCAVQAICRAGISADVSSGLELELALQCGFEHIVLSGPAKTDAELTLALENSERVTVHLDSFRELERLEYLAAQMGRNIDVGIRLNTQGHGLWTKFGIPMQALPKLVQCAEEASHVFLRGVQFHLSWNRNSSGYLHTLSDLGAVLSAHAPQGGWQFVDIGGGYYPEDDEAVYPWLTDRGRLLSLLNAAPADGPPEDWDLQYLLHTVQPIESMATDILNGFAKFVRSSCDVDLWLEPGRYLVNPAVHLLLGVVDVKHVDVAITDGGTNLLGWERLESEHCPLINLTHPAHTQRAARVYGSLCTPHDLWGYAYYGSELQEGDVLMLPAQGSYVQTLAQRFIKPICQTIVLDEEGDLHRVMAEETLQDRYPQLSAETV